jgi:hypothetical protein
MIDIRRSFASFLAAMGLAREVICPLNGIKISVLAVGADLINEPGRDNVSDIAYYTALGL